MHIIIGDYMKVLITGAFSGIGYNTGLYFLKHNHKVILTVHNEKELKLLKEKVKDLKNIECYKLDITNSEDRKKITDLDVDILINNASIGIGGNLLNISSDKIKEIFNVNVFSTLELSRLFLGHLIANKKQGQVIFISSLAGNFPITNMGAYCMTKTCIIMMSKILKKELRKFKNIKIKVIEPGIYNTGFNEVMFNYINDYNTYKNKKNLFNIIGSNNLNTISKTIYKSINSDKLIYRDSYLASLLVKIYYLLFS